MGAPLCEDELNDCCCDCCVSGIGGIDCSKLLFVSTVECRLVRGKKSEFSRRKPRIKFCGNFESDSCRLCVALALRVKALVTEDLLLFFATLLTPGPLSGWNPFGVCGCCCRGNSAKLHLCNFCSAFNVLIFDDVRVAALERLITPPLNSPLFCLRKNFSISQSRNKTTSSQILSRSTLPYDLMT
uniref:Uncharacterized protein n=1 Tax=Glossina pallidipes TaxID=7398 RepID=A0A1B0AD13_GLOPL